MYNIFVNLDSSTNIVHGISIPNIGRALIIYGVGAQEEKASK
jgi:hypothetical protein